MLKKFRFRWDGKGEGEKREVVSNETGSEHSGVLFPQLFGGNT